MLSLNTQGGVVMAAKLLPEDLWIEVEPMLPPPPPRSPKGGRPPVCNKAALKGIIFILRFGIPWQALPTDLFGVSGSSCWRRFDEWTQAGIWPELHRRLLNRLGKLGGVDHSFAVVDSQSVRAVKGGPIPAPILPTAARRAANAMS
jgi:transposase